MAFPRFYFIGFVIFFCPTIVNDITVSICDVPNEMEPVFFLIFGLKTTFDRWPFGLDRLGGQDPVQLV